MYFIQQQSPLYVVSDSTGIPQYWYVHDKSFPKKDQRFLEQYLKDGAEILQREVGVLADTHKPFQEEEERRMRAMLDILLYARSVWNEEDERGSF